MRGSILLGVFAAFAFVACGQSANEAVQSTSASAVVAGTPTPAPRGPGGWLVETDTLVAFLSLSGADSLLTGTMVGGYLSYGHVVETFTASVYGSVADDGTLSLSLDPPPPIAASDQVTGTVAGSLLELTYPDQSAALVTLAFSRADAADYNAALDAMRQREGEAQTTDDEAAAAAIAAAELETCSRAVLGHDAVVWVYLPYGDAATACKDVKRYDISDGEWALPVQPASPDISGRLVCKGSLAKALVYVYDAGGAFYGGLICAELPELPYMGINVETASSGPGLQILLDGIEPGSPAARAGLRERDLILFVDKLPVYNDVNLDAILAQHAPGDVVRVYLERDGKDVDLELTLGRP